MNQLKYSKQKQVGKKSMDVQEFQKWQGRESDLQRACEQVLDLLGITYIRLPDSLYRSIFANKRISAHIKKEIARSIKGLPDIIILLPDEDEIYCKACCIELKTKSGKLTQGQKNFAKRLPVIVVRSFEQFQQVVNDFVKD